MASTAAGNPGSGSPDRRSSGSTGSSSNNMPPSAMASANGQPKARPYRVSYGATTEVPTVQVASPTGEDDDSRTLTYGNGYSAYNGDGDDEDDCLDDLVDEAMQNALQNVSWVWMSRMYLLVPVITALVFASMVALVTWGWPPSKDEQDAGQQYPHPFFWKAFLVGLFASFTVQSLRVPMYIATSWLPLSNPWAVFISTVLHCIGHEAVRLISVPLTIASPTSGFHSSYWLGLGWGLAETAWGIVQGWEQLSLYEDVVKLPPHVSAWSDSGESGLTTVPEETELLNDDDDLDEEGRLEDEEELERRVQVLERMRARQELEEVMGLPFPLIPFPLHILWRIDTLLLNLGLTLILSAFWFDPEPIYKHDHIHGVRAQGEWPPAAPNATPSPYLPVAWTLVTFLHIIVALVWKVVGRVGVEAVTWGGLILALGSVFAGLGCWGGLV